MENYTAAQFTAIQNIYSYFNGQLFNGQLNNCLLNFSRKSKAMGFFAPCRWGKDGEKSTIHEISLNPEFLKMGVQETLQTLLHEMCHLWQQDFGKATAGYHNKQWAEKMQSVGLMPSTTGAEGGKTIGKGMSDYAIEGGVFLKVVAKMPKSYLYPFVCMAEVEKGKKASKSKNKTKYTCSGCSTNIWGKDGLVITCNDCDTLFQTESNEA